MSPAGASDASGGARWHAVLFMTGRGLGAAAGAGNAAAWAFAMWMPSGGPTPFRGIALAVAFLMCVASVMAALAAWRAQRGLLLGLFLVAFLPVGALLLRAEHWLYWIAWSDLALLAAVGLMHVGAPADTGRAQAPAADERG